MEISFNLKKELYDKLFVFFYSIGGPYSVFPSKGSDSVAFLVNYNSWRILELRYENDNKKLKYRFFDGRSDREIKEIEDVYSMLNTLSVYRYPFMKIFSIFLQSKLL